MDRNMKKKHLNIIEYTMDLDCHFDNENSGYRYLKFDIPIANKHFHLTYQGESEEILLTEECDINQLKKLYFQLKNIFEKEL